MLENYFVVYQKSYMSYHIYRMLAVKMGESICTKHEERKTITFSVSFRRAFIYSLRSDMALVWSSEMQNLPQRPSGFHFSSFQSLKKRFFSTTHSCTIFLLWYYEQEVSDKQRFKISWLDQCRVGPSTSPLSLQMLLFGSSSILRLYLEIFG